MSLSRRTFTKEFKEGAVQRLELGASIADVVHACEVNANVLHLWRRELRECAAKAFPGEGRSWSGKVGRQAMEIGFLRRCLQHVEEQRKFQALTTRSSPGDQGARTHSSDLNSICSVASRLGTRAFPSLATFREADFSGQILMWDRDCPTSKDLQRIEPGGEVPGNGTTPLPFQTSFGEEEDMRRYAESTE
jgi:transposase